MDDVNVNAPFADVLRQHIKIAPPFVANDFAAGKTPHWYDLVNEPKAGLVHRLYKCAA